MVKTKWAAAALTILLAAPGVAACNLTSGGGQPTQEQEVEDCDAEDYRNREDDCGFTDADRRKTKAPTKPQGRPTKRRV
jgi:predicted small secreted protein